MSFRSDRGSFSFAGTFPDSNSFYIPDIIKVSTDYTDDGRYNATSAAYSRKNLTGKSLSEALEYVRPQFQALRRKDGHKICLQAKFAHEPHTWMNIPDDEFPELIGSITELKVLVWRNSHQTWE